MEHKLTARIAALRRHAQRSHRSVVPGTAPGTLEPASAERGTPAEQARVSSLVYNQRGIVAEHDGLPQVGPDPDATDITWVHLQGTPSAAQLQALGARFGLHPLALEDVFSREQRPKAESYERQLFVVFNDLRRDADGGLHTDPVCFFLGAHYLISIAPGAAPLFAPIRARLHGGDRILAAGADYLLYALADLVIDRGFPLLYELGNELELLEDAILDEPSEEARDRLHYARRELVAVRRALWPHRDVVAALMRNDSAFLSATTRLYLRDCHDHCVTLIDFVETCRELTASLLDTYLSAVSQRMNDVMKTLTIISTIFLPLTFIAGVYGMNFNTASPWNMPELGWRFGYLYSLLVMLGIALAMVLYFRHKHWL